MNFDIDRRGIRGIGCRGQNGRKQHRYENEKGAFSHMDKLLRNGYYNKEPHPFSKGKAAGAAGIPGRRLPVKASTILGRCPLYYSRKGAKENENSLNIPFPVQKSIQHHTTRKAGTFV
jgi:hypothetical protein